MTVLLWDGSGLWLRECLLVAIHLQRRGVRQRRRVFFVFSVFLGCWDGSLIGLLKI